MTKILFNITHGFQARMLLRTAIAEGLLSVGCQLVVVSPNADEEYFVQEFNHPQIVLVKNPGRFGRVESHLINLRQYFLMNPRLGGTLNHKNERLRANSPLFYWFARFVNLFLGRLGFLRQAYIWAEARVFSGREYLPLLQEQQPDLVVTGTPGYNPSDIHLLRTAKRCRIPTATVMLSWDNLTSKGYMGAIPDNLLVWSDLMAQEAIGYHDYPPANIQWVGAAQFDLYAQVRERFDRMDWRRERSISLDRPLIVYGSINPGILPHEIKIIQQIIAALQTWEPAQRPHLWIRLHPQVVKGFWSQGLQQFLDLASPDVTVEVPKVVSDQLSWDLPKEDAEHLAQLLAAADIVLTPGSTLVIDAACAGTPSISIGFDGPDPVPSGFSVIRFVHYTHYAKLLETKALPVAHDLGELMHWIRFYISQPSGDFPGRQVVIRQQLNELDGQAGRRTADKLLALAKQGLS